VDLSAPTPSAAEGSAVATTAYSPGSAFGGEAAPSVPLAMLLETLDQGSLVDELQAEQEADLDMAALEAASTTSDLSDPLKLSSVTTLTAAAQKLLSEQRSKLTDELSARRQLILLLGTSIERQYAQCGALAEALSGCEKLLQVAQKAADHIAAGSSIDGTTFEP